MLKNDTLKNGTSRIGLYGGAPRGRGGGGVEYKWLWLNTTRKNLLGFSFVIDNQAL